MRVSDDVSKSKRCFDRGNADRFFLACVVIDNLGVVSFVRHSKFL